MVLGRLIINEVVETGLANPMPLDDVSQVINGDVGRAVKCCTHGSDLDCLDRLSIVYLCVRLWTNCPRDTGYSHSKLLSKRKYALNKEAFSRRQYMRKSSVKIGIEKVTVDEFLLYESEKLTLNEVQINNNNNNNNNFYLLLLLLRGQITGFTP